MYVFLRSASEKLELYGVVKLLDSPVKQLEASSIASFDGTFLILGGIVSEKAFNFEARFRNFDDASA